MMQDWADRLDMLERGQMEAASVNLTVHIEGVPAVKDAERGPATERLRPADSDASSMRALLNVASTSEGNHLMKRLSPLPMVAEPELKPDISEIQRKHQEMLAVYEAPDNLAVTQFAKLAGKSRDQVNRELKAGKLLALKMGNRGQGVPGWQLDPVKSKLTQTVLGLVGKDNVWKLYSALTQPRHYLDGMAPIGHVTPFNLQAVADIVISLDV
jgi:hypothetical protein